MAERDKMTFSFFIREQYLTKINKIDIAQNIKIATKCNIGRLMKFNESTKFVHLFIRITDDYSKRSKYIQLHTYVF